MKLPEKIIRYNQTLKEKLAGQITKTTEKILDDLKCYEEAIKELENTDISNAVYLLDLHLTVEYGGSLEQAVKLAEQLSKPKNVKVKNVKYGIVLNLGDILDVGIGEVVFEKYRLIRNGSL